MKEWILQTAKDHWPAMQATIIAVVSGIVLNVVNGLIDSPSEKSGKIGKALHFLLDRVLPTVLSNKNTPGTFKLPFGASDSDNRIAKYEAATEKEAAETAATPPPPPEAA